MADNWQLTGRSKNQRLWRLISAVVALLWVGDCVVMGFDQDSVWARDWVFWLLLVICSMVMFYSARRGGLILVDRGARQSERVAEDKKPDSEE